MDEQDQQDLASEGVGQSTGVSATLLESVLARIGDGVLITDAEFRPVYYNRAFAKLDLPAEYFTADLPFGFFAGIPQSGQQIDEAELEQRLRMAEAVSLTRGHYTSNDQLRWCRVEVTPCSLDDGTGGYLGIFTDQSEFLEQARQLSQAVRNLSELSLIDSQTGLHNRRWFASHLHRYWHEAMREIRPLTLLLISLDQQGYQADGEHHRQEDVIYRVAYTLNCVLKRASDMLARYDEHHFILLTNTITQDQLEELMLMIHREIAAMKLPADEPGLQYTVSIGAVHGVPHPNSSSESMLKLAHQAVSEASEAGGDCFRSYTL